MFVKNEGNWESDEKLEDKESESDNDIFYDLEFGRICEDFEDVLVGTRFDDIRRNDVTKEESYISYHRNSKIRKLRGVFNPLFQTWIKIKSTRKASEEKQNMTSLKIWKKMNEWENEIYSKFEELKKKVLNELKTCSSEIETHFVSYVSVELFVYLFVELRDICGAQFGRNAESKSEGDILDFSFSLCKNYMKTKFESRRKSFLSEYIQQECYSKREILSLVTVIRSYTIEADTVIDNPKWLEFFFKCLRCIYEMDVPDETYLDKNMIIFKSIENLIRRCVDRNELEKAWLLMSLILRFLSGESFGISGRRFISCFIDLCSLSGRAVPLVKIHKEFIQGWHDGMCLGLMMGVVDGCSICFDSYMSISKHYLRMGGKSVDKAKEYINIATRAVEREETIEKFPVANTFLSYSQRVMGFEVRAMLNMRKGDWIECALNLRCAFVLIRKRVEKHPKFKKILETQSDRIGKAISIVENSVPNPKNNKKKRKSELKKYRKDLLDLWDLRPPEKRFEEFEFRENEEIMEFFNIINGSITGGKEKISDYLKKLEDSYLINAICNGLDEKVCKVCRKGGVKLNRCSRCKKVKYCSRKCQIVDWKSHKDWCNTFELTNK